MLKILLEKFQNVKKQGVSVVLPSDRHIVLSIIHR